MLKTTGFAILSALFLTAAACGGKSSPKSTTTTHTETTVQDESGAESSRETTETHVEHQDGTQDIERTETTTQTVPPATTTTP